MEVEYEGEDFRIGFTPGDCATAVIAFAGIGHQIGGVPTEEFRKSLAGVQVGRRAAFLIHVVEKQRVWYNNGGVGRALGVLIPLIERLGTTDVVTLGNSMGGFGAVAFCARLPMARAAIAFCPQSSVDPGVVPFEKRWLALRRNIRSWDIRDAVAELASAKTYDLFHGTEDVTDAQHSARFARAGLPHLHVHAIPGCGHNVAGALRQRDQLRGILQGLIWNTECSGPDTSRAVATSGAAPRLPVHPTTEF